MDAGLLMELSSVVLPQMCIFCWCEFFRVCELLKTLCVCVYGIIWKVCAKALLMLINYPLITGM